MAKNGFDPFQMTLYILNFNVNKWLTSKGRVSMKNGFPITLSSPYQISLLTNARF